MMFKKTNVTRKLFWDDVRQVCIQNEYYTHGDNEDYSALLKYIDTLGEVNDQALFNIAQDIYNHSDIERIMNEGGVDECGAFESIIFNITEKVHTFYKVEEV